jgi:MATE family multidrug resistance protein
MPFMSTKGRDSQGELSLNKARKGDLRLMLLIAGPNIATTAAETGLSMVDYLIVSQLGSQAQAAVSTAGVLFFTVFALPLGILICVTTMVSQSLGAGRKRDCAAYAWQGLRLSLPAVVVSVVFWHLTPSLFEAIGHEPAVQEMEVDYMRVRLLSLGAACGSVALGTYFNGIHHPGRNTVSVVGANVLNGVLTYMLVLGKWGAPALGVAGAAWGTVIATLVRLAWLWWTMCFSRLGVEFDARRAWRFDWDKMRRIIWVGLPSGASLVLDIGGWAAFMAFVIAEFGTAHMAATATCWRFIELSFMPAIGIGAAVTTLVGKSIGEKRFDRARRRAALGTKLNMTYMGFMALLFVTFGDAMMRLFSDEAEVIAIGTQILMFAAVFQLLDAVAITYSYALRGAGDTHWPAFVGAVENWGIMVFGGYWVAKAHPEFGSKGPWAFATLFVCLIGITLWYRWRQGKWEQFDVIGREEQPIAHQEVVGAEPFQPDVVMTPQTTGEHKE